MNIYFRNILYFTHESDIQCIQKVFRPFLLFHILLHNSLILKWIKYICFSSIYTQYPIMTKQKLFFRNFSKWKEKAPQFSYFQVAPKIAFSLQATMGHDSPLCAKLAPNVRELPVQRQCFCKNIVKTIVDDMVQNGGELETTM